ncbi:MAG: UvrD-helicase domain-containing protein, partial [Clostridia bacterium]|nr:UvrD-helicase domain-containing protein [Clostridia bacterium]
MATKWTDEQLSAIESRGQNLLLSAAAGSGKTAVLVERIISRIANDENPIDADKLLVVTFTNAAANEMRERIEKALEQLYIKNPQNKNIARQLTLIKKAQITTIDSFCIDVLRKNFVEANLSPDFGVADPTESKVMLDQALDDVINEMYDDKNFGADFLYLMESYANSKANDAGFRDLITSIYYFSTSLPYPDEWLDEACSRFILDDGFSDSYYKDALMKEAYAECERAVSEYEIMIDLSDEDTLFNFSSILKEEKYFFEECIKTVDYDELRQKLLGYTFKRRPQTPKNITPIHLDTINDMRTKIKVRRMGKLCEKLLVLSSRQQEDAIKKMYPQMKCLSETVKRLSKKFSDMKLSKNLLDFSDCEHYCLN